MSTTPESTTGGGFTLHRDARQRLVLVDAAGCVHEDVEPVRCFPISHPQNWIAICDALGHELVRIQDPTALPPDVRQTLETELAGHEFVPVVERIIKVVEEADHCQWYTETDRGPVSFRTSDEDAVRRLDDQRAMILDLNGIRYLVPDITVLDRASRRLLDQYL
jgi:hypothetical protein